MYSAHIAVVLMLLLLLLYACRRFERVVRLLADTKHVLVFHNTIVYIRARVISEMNYVKFL